jgi:ribosomal protein S18 acetylase RimI-like enzyme
MEDPPNQDNPSGPRIRFATVSDAAALAQLRYALRASTGRASEPQAEFVERCTAWMESHLKEERWLCWVTEENQRLVGAVWIQLVEKIPNPRAEYEQHAYLTNFYIDETARGRGLGSRLLREVIEWCAVRDVHAVILWPTDRSRSLYQRHGFAVREDIMELVLNPPAN